MMKRPFDRDNDAIWDRAKSLWEEWAADLDKVDREIGEMGLDWIEGYLYDTRDLSNAMSMASDCCMDMARNIHDDYRKLSVEGIADTMYDAVANYIKFFERALTELSPPT